MTLEVFFSYDSEDRLIVNRIKDGIEARVGGNINIYIYEEDLKPGTIIPTKAKNRIREADLFLVLITPNSQDSVWVQQEVGFANGVDCTVVPILLDVPERPELKGLLGGMEYMFFDQDNPNDFFEEFIDYATDTWDIHTDENVPSDADERRMGYLLPLDSPDDEDHIIIESPVEVYRRDDNRHEVVAETAGQIINLGIRDASVSRKNGGTAPVIFEPNGPGRVTLYNNGATNPVTVDYGIGRKPATVQKDETETLTHTCTVKIGFDTKLELGFSIFEVPPVSKSERSE